MLRDSDRKDTPVGGPSWERATVQQPSNAGPCALPEQLAHLSCEAATACAEITGGFTLSSTTTILPDHPVLSVNRGYETASKHCHFPVAEGVG